MVLVNGTKYACQSCIKGHRSSSCRHNERPLFEVQRKGRPVSQCEKCRELREKKRVHSKCLCNGASSVEAPGPRHWKYDFDSPDLPSGLKDIACPTPAGPTASKMRVHGLMNACECADECDCGSCEHPEETLLGTMPKANLGLVVLAQAAAIVESGGPLPPKQGKPQTNKPKKRTRERSASPAIPQIQPKRNKSLPEPIAASKSSCCASRRATSSEVPVLPALLLHPTPVASIPAPKISLPVIDVPSRPSPYKHATTGGCCCGWQCSCPGCTEHRGHDHADAAHANCASADCPTCVDNESGLGIHDPLPVLTFATVPAPSTAVMDALFSHRPYL